MSDVTVWLGELLKDAQQPKMKASGPAARTDIDIDIDIWIYIDI